MVFVEGDDYRQLRRPGGDPARFRSPVRFGAVPSSAVVDGLIAWYRFEDSADTAIDYTAELDDDRFADTTPYDGTVNGASFVPNGGVRDVVSSTGSNSGAYNFDGVDDKIVTPKEVPIDTGSVTAMAWVIPSVLETKKGRIFASSSTNNNKDFKRLLLSASDDVTEFALGDGEDQTVLLGSALSSGSLTHLAVTGDGTTIRAYRNGTEVLDGTYPPGSFSLPVSIGRSPGRPHFGGIIDDARLYNRALSASEINQIYANTDPDQ
jgi:sialidase-1